ncbi:MAG TPA: AI-2E family transporter [Bryobacteraceae bacterium]|jgi:predicted PurR-regulated permease PerM
MQRPAGLSIDSRRTLLWAACIAIAFLFVWYAWKLLLLAFAGLLLAVIIHAFADLFERFTHLGPKSSFALTVISFAALIALAIWLIAPRAISEGGQVVKVVPQSLAQAQEYLNQTTWGAFTVRVVRRAMSASAEGTRVTSIASDLVNAVGAAVVVIVVGFYAALNPGEYSSGLLRLIPESQRDRAREVARAVIYTLRWWLLGQLVPMIVLGAATMIGLWVLDIPLAFALGLFTALMIFIPYLGALASAIPAILVGLQQGPMTAIYVAVLYLCIHSAEGYFLTPLVQKRAVRLPPIMTILAQLLMWMITGLLGVALATPLAAAALVLVKMLYLHENVEYK